MSRTRKFGRVYVQDRRDGRYRLAFRRLSKRTSRYWNSGTLLDQGNTPSCVGHAWAGWLMSSAVKSFLPPLGIYDIAKRYDEYKGENYDGTSVRAGAQVLQLLGLIGSYRWAKTSKEVAQTLLEVGPVVMGTDWFAGMSEPDPKNVLHVTGENEGGHAWLLDGVNVAKELFRMRQSWGPTFGAKGHAYISFGSIDQLLAAQGEACVGLEQKPYPTLKPAG